MAKKIKQLRFYNSGSAQNEPANSTTTDWATGNVISNFLPIVQLGIYAPPGTQFYVNNGSAIIMGYTGLFELDMSNGGEINYLRFDTSSLNLINSNSSAQIFVDIVYEGGN